MVVLTFLADSVKGNYLFGKLRLFGGLSQFSGTENGRWGIVYLSNKVITSVRPLF